MTEIKHKSASTADSPKRREKESGKYFEAVGRRKTSVARVRVWNAKEYSISVNGKDFKIYFPTQELRNIIEQPFKNLKVLGKFKISVKVNGGGIHSQAEAVRHGISRSLVKFNNELRKNLKKAGFLKRDQRMKERRKFGLKKARKAPQWSKR